VKRFNATRFGERVSPTLENASLGVLHYRGSCSAGTIGAPCNVSGDCGTGGVCILTATTADDSTVLRWSDPDIEESDLYRGTIAGSNKGTLAAAQQYFHVSSWKLNTFATGGGSATCFKHNISGIRTNPGTNYSSGVLSQADDPDPGVGSATYYLAIARVTQHGSSVSLNDLGCANPGVCSNRGWCILGSNPGAPCNDNSACDVGGTCQFKRSYCSMDIGVADLGGCGAHQVCAGGSNMGMLCNSLTDCPGSSCPPLPATTSTPGQVCLNLTGAALSRNGCLNTSQPKSVLRVSTRTCLTPLASFGNACDLDGDCDSAPGSGDGSCSASRQCP
jgi:hypothetical protein